MSAPDFDEQGRLVGPPLQEFQRYIEEGMSCIVKLVIANPGPGNRSVQFSMTPEQCRRMAHDLLLCAQVIELERPTSAQ